MTSMQRCRLLFITAILPEARALARAFHLPGKFTNLVEWTPSRPPTQGISPLKDSTPDRAADGHAEDASTPHALEPVPDIAISLAGIRACNLAKLALQIAPTEGIIMAGLAGALVPRLNIADVLVAGELAASVPYPVEPLTRLADSSTIVATPHDKAQLAAATGAWAVDMETHRVAAWAQTLGIPFLAIRAISDAANEPIDKQLLQLVDKDGHPRIGRALAMLVRHPGKLAAMLHLKKNSDAALRKLAEVAHAVAASGWPSEIKPPSKRQEPFSAAEPERKNF